LTQNQVTVTTTSMKWQPTCFRFRWPCIINVWEERTNSWHRYRCSFTM